MTDAFEPLVVAKQGSFFAGGTITPDPGPVDLTAFSDPRGKYSGHVNHVYAQYQVPVDARALPIVLWGGGGLSAKAWETTSDGREGYQTLLLRQGWAVYALDQPGRGRASRAAVGSVHGGWGGGEASRYLYWRLGIWPDFFPGVQFDQSPAALGQFWRQCLPDTEPTPAFTDAITDAVSDLFSQIGPAILVTHSASGKLGFRTRIKTDRLRAIVSYEPTTFIWPSDATPPAMDGLDPAVAQLTTPIVVSPQEFDQLIESPIQIVFGDNIPKEPSPYPGLDLWRVIMTRAEHFAQVANGRGGDVEILRLPEMGLRGNTHFPFSDLNNVVVADLLNDFLTRKGLTGRG